MYAYVRLKSPKHMNAHSFGKWLNLLFFPSVVHLNLFYHFFFFLFLSGCFFFRVMKNHAIFISWVHISIHNGVYKYTCVFGFGYFDAISAYDRHFCQRNRYESLFSPPLSLFLTPHTQKARALWYMLNESNIHIIYIICVTLKEKTLLSNYRFSNAIAKV